SRRTLTAAGYFQAASDRLLQPAAHVFYAYMRMFPCGRDLPRLIHSNAIVGDGHQGAVVVLLRAYGYGAAVPPVQHAVLNRVLHQGLERQRRYAEVRNLDAV